MIQRTQRKDKNTKQVKIIEQPTKLKFYKECGFERTLNRRDISTSINKKGSK